MVEVVVLVQGERHSFCGLYTRLCLVSNSQGVDVKRLYDNNSKSRVSGTSEIFVLVASSCMTAYTLMLNHGCSRLHGRTSSSCCLPSASNNVTTCIYTSQLPGTLAPFITIIPSMSCNALAVRSHCWVAVGTARPISSSHLIALACVCMFVSLRQSCMPTTRSGWSPQ